jgi:hypothetical protein
MNRALALLMMSVIVAASALALASVADAKVRFFGLQRIFYPLPPPRAPRFRETPVYAPDAPPPRFYDNPGIPDFQNGSRG